MAITLAQAKVILGASWRTARNSIAGLSGDVTLAGVANVRTTEVLWNEQRSASGILQAPTSNAPSPVVGVGTFYATPGLSDSVKVWTYAGGVATDYTEFTGVDARELLTYGVLYPSAINALPVATPGGSGWAGPGYTASDVASVAGNTATSGTIISAPGAGLRLNVLSYAIITGFVPGIYQLRDTNASGTVRWHCTVDNNLQQVVSASQILKLFSTAANVPLYAVVPGGSSLNYNLSYYVSA